MTDTAGGWMAAVMLSQVNDLSCVDAAHWYLEQGLRPIPWVVGDEGGKRAAISGFTYQAYTVTHGDIDRWSPGWQVGLALGDHGSRVYAIDVDSYAELHEWQNQHGAGVGLGPSWRQTSGRGDGGEHRLYRAGALWPRHGKFSGEYTHLEVISNGLLAVSPSVHPSGRRYRWTTDATPEIREAGPLLAQYLGEREVARATNGSKSYPSGGSGGSNQGGDSGRPDIGALLRDGIQSEQDVTLRDVVWFGVMDGKSFEEIHLLWQAIVFKTPLTKPSPWNATYVPPGQRPPGHEVSDFERHYDSAVGKLRDREPIRVEEWQWELVRLWQEQSAAGLPYQDGAPVEPAAGTFSGAVTPDEVALVALEREVTQRYMFKVIDALADQRIIDENLPPFEDMTLLEVMNEPPGPQVLPGVLPVGVVGLAGPAEAGKSLIVRDWINAVVNRVVWRGYQAAVARSATYVVGEGRSGIPLRFRGVAPDRVSVCTPVNLTSKTEIDRFLLSRPEDTGLVVFDMLYHMGISEENKAADVFPLLHAAQRISDELEACVILVGHPGHNEERRFRGTSAMRGFFSAEFHAAEGLFTCEKMKDGDTKAALRGQYTIEYPRINWATTMEQIAEAAGIEVARRERVRLTIELHPDAGDREISRMLDGELGVGLESWRRIVRSVRAELRGEDDAEGVA